MIYFHLIQENKHWGGDVKLINDLKKKNNKKTSFQASSKKRFDEMSENVEFVRDRNTWS